MLLAQRHRRASPAPAWNHALAVAAAGLGAREAVEFTSASLNIKVGGMYPTEGEADLVAIDWSVKGEWDSTGQQALFLCSPANTLDTPAASILLRYAAQDDEWTSLHEPFAGIAFGHGYDATAYDPVGRILYKSDHKFDNTDRILRWDVAGWQELSKKSPPTNFGFTWDQECAMCWVPWGAQGKLVYVGKKNGGGSAMAWWDKATNVWSLVWEGSSFGTTQVVCHYNPVADRVVFGYAATGGTLKVIDSAGTVQTTDTTPTNVNTGSPGNYVFVPDPNGVESLVFANNDLHIYGLNPLTLVWTDYGARSWYTTASHDVGWSIPEHNAILFCVYGIGGTNKGYLYRHSQ